jgi:2-amino-4-hydroxy-6-hydroxymethyldihydropteridine diphosphokinase
MKLKKVALAFGSNIGDRKNSILQSVDLLAEGGLFELRCSRIMESLPVDCPDGSEMFLNGAVVGLWGGSCRELLKLCQQIELTLGRKGIRPINSPRPIDLDILLFANEEYDEEGLIVPHERMHLRDFVLLPLRELESTWYIAKFNKTVEDLCEDL